MVNSAHKYPPFWHLLWIKAIMVMPILTKIMLPTKSRESTHEHQSQNLPTQQSSLKYVGHGLVSQKQSVYPLWTLCMGPPQRFLVTQSSPWENEGMLYCIKEQVRSGDAGYQCAVQWVGGGGAETSFLHQGELLSGLRSSWSWCSCNAMQCTWLVQCKRPEPDDHRRGVRGCSESELHRRSLGQTHAFPALPTPSFALPCLHKRFLLQFFLKPAEGLLAAPKWIFFWKCPKGGLGCFWSQKNLWRLWHSK